MPPKSKPGAKVKKPSPRDKNKNKPPRGKKKDTVETKEPSLTVEEELAAANRTIYQQDVKIEELEAQVELLNETRIGARQVETLNSILQIIDTQFSRYKDVLYETDTETRAKMRFVMESFLVDGLDKVNRNKRLGQDVEEYWKGEIEGGVDGKSRTAIMKLSYAQAMYKNIEVYRHYQKEEQPMNDGSNDPRDIERFVDSDKEEDAIPADDLTLKIEARLNDEGSFR